MMLEFSRSAPSGPLLRTTPLVSRQPSHSGPLLRTTPLVSRQQSHALRMTGTSILYARRWLLMKPYFMRGMTKCVKLQAVQRPPYCGERLWYLGAPGRCLLATMQCSVANTISIVWGALTLHNWKRIRAPPFSCPRLTRRMDKVRSFSVLGVKDLSFLIGSSGGPLITRDAKTQQSWYCRAAAVRFMRLSYDSQHSCDSILLGRTTAVKCSCGCLTTVARQRQEIIHSNPSLKTCELLQNLESIVRVSQDCLVAALRCLKKSKKSQK